MEMIATVIVIGIIIIIAFRSAKDDKQPEPPAMQTQTYETTCNSHELADLKQRIVILEQTVSGIRQILCDSTTSHSYRDETRYDGYGYSDDCRPRNRRQSGEHRRRTE